MATSENKTYHTTGIGSLPFNTTKEAVDYALSHDIAFLPQLPHLEGNMIKACKEKVCLCLDEINSRPIKGPLKIQIPGPLSSNLNIDTIVDYYHYLKSNLIHKDLIVFIDEPFFPKIINGHSEIVELIRNDHPIGLHSCGHFNLADVISLDLDFLSYDIHLDHQFSLEDVLNCNIEPVLGIVPTMNECNINKLEQEIFPTILKSTKAIHLSATCGLADRNIDTTAVLKNLIKIKERLSRS